MKILIQQRLFLLLSIVSDYAQSYVFDFSHTKKTHIKTKIFSFVLVQETIWSLSLRKVWIGCPKLCTHFTKIEQSYWNFWSDFLIVCTHLVHVAIETKGSWTCRHTLPWVSAFANKSINRIVQLGGAFVFSLLSHGYWHLYFNIITVTLGLNEM